MVYKEMQKSKILKNLIAGFGSKIVVIALGFIIPRIILVNYGSDVNGIINSIGQIFGYMALLEAGIGFAAENMLYKPIVEKDRAGVSYVATVAQRYFNKFTILYAIGVMVMAVVIPLTWKSNVEKTTIFLLIFFEGMSGVLSFLFTETPLAILRADGKSYVYNAIGALRAVLGQSAKIIIFSLGIRIDALQFTFCLITLVQIIIYKWYFKKHYSWIDYHAAPKNAKLKNRKSYVTSEIAWVIFSSTDLIILSTFADTVVSSVYSIYNMVIGSVTTVMHTIYNSVVYLLGQAYFENIEKYKKVHDAFNSVFVGAQTVLMSVTYILIIPFIRLYTKGVSDTNYIYEYVPLLFCLIQLLSFSSYVTKNLANIAGYAKQSGNISVIEAILNLILSLLLVGKLGIYGVLLATVISLPLKVIYCIYLSDKKILKRSYKKTVKILGINYLCFFTAVILEKYIQLKIDNYLQFFGAGIVTTIICLLVGMTANILVNPECIEIVKLFYKKARR